MSFVFFVLFQNTFKIDVFVPDLVKNMSFKVNKKDRKKITSFVFFDLFRSFSSFFPDLVNKMSSTMPPGKSQGFLFVVGPPPPNNP